MENNTAVKEEGPIAGAESQSQNETSGVSVAEAVPGEVKNEPNELSESALNNSSVSDELITLQEVIETQAELEDEAEDLLGGENETVCTYPEGYKPRQPLYSCRECVNESSQAGICYGCSINCHDGHDLVELYSKRNFCCDCGNSKFKNQCKLYEGKVPLNNRNTYNHNFDGKYCTCDQPYLGDDDMFQCGICEDWFHLEHLSKGEGGFDLDSAEELCCGSCVERLQFLLAYSDENYKEEGLVEGECKLKKLSASLKSKDVCKNALAFRSYKWRKRLCKCQDCLNLYEDLNVTYLTDISDSVEEFVTNNRNSAEPKLTSDAEDRKFDRMVVEKVGRDTAITLFAGFEEMKQKVVATMKRAADEGREVRKEDIDTAFAELRSAQKRRRLGAASTSAVAE